MSLFMNHPSRRKNCNRKEIRLQKKIAQKIKAAEKAQIQQEIYLLKIKKKQEKAIEKERRAKERGLALA